MNEKRINFNDIDSLNRLSKETLVNLVASMHKEKLKDEAEIATLKELKRLREIGPFIPQTERTGFLFNEVEAINLNDELASEKFVEVKAHTRRVSHKVTVLPPDTPIVTVSHSEAAEDAITINGAEYERCEDKVVDRIGLRPATRFIERHTYPQYRLKNWIAEKDDEEKNKLVLWRNEETDKIMAGSSLVAQVAVSKYADAIPLYRQEQMFQRTGLEFSRQVLCSWLLAYSRLLAPLSKVLEKQVSTSQLVNMDETPIQLLNFGEDKESKTCFMLVRIGNSDGHKTILFNYLQNRKMETLASHFPTDKNTWVMTDGLKQYLAIGDRHLSCWTHAMRMFKNVLKVNSSAPFAKSMIKTMNELYITENDLRSQLDAGKITTEEFDKSRKASTSIIFDKIKTKLEIGRNSYPDKSLTGKAISYCFTYWNSLIRYPECTLSTPDNNAAENSIRPFTLGRKNWLFSASEDGATASALYYSLIETAKANKLNVYSYLWHLMEKAPDCHVDADWEKLLPWNIDNTDMEKTISIASVAKVDPTRGEDYIIRGVK